MLEFHGWITLRYGNSEKDENLQAVFVQKVKDFISQKYPYLIDKGLLHFSFQNSEDFLMISGLCNHKNEPFDVKEIFEWVAVNSKGSYGLLHFHDDDFNDDFEVLVLKRGKLIGYKDVYLSPFIPECEPPEQSSNDFLH
jgi:hypothetical protein